VILDGERQNSSVVVVSSARAFGRLLRP
jgi:hypothetical protein